MRVALVFRIVGWGLILWAMLQITLHLWTVFSFARAFGNHAEGGLVIGAMLGPIPYFLIWLAAGVLLLFLAWQPRRNERRQGKL